MECQYCGGTIKKDSKSPKREKKFCCRDHYLAFKERERNSIKSYCLQCGAPITTLTSKGKIRKYCSDECIKAHRGENAYKYTICQYCGKSFKETRDKPNLYCSRQCLNKALKSFELYKVKDRPKEYDGIDHHKALLDEYTELIKKAEQIRIRLEREKVCKNCGTIFIAKSKKGTYCSEICARKADTTRRDKRITRNGKADSSITLTKLYMRDLGTCQICGKALDFDRDYNDDEYPSIDHIQPLSKGGLHQWDNVQLACRKCNTLKGATYPD